MHRHGTSRFLDNIAIVMREQQDRLFRMIDYIVGEVGLIVDNQRDAVAARNVVGSDDGDFVPRDSGTIVDLDDAPASHGASDRGAVEHARHREVVEVSRLAGHLGATLAAWHGLSNHSVGP